MMSFMWAEYRIINRLIVGMIPTCTKMKISSKVIPQNFCTSGNFPLLNNPQSTRILSPSFGGWVWERDYSAVIVIMWTGHTSNFVAMWIISSL